MGSRSGIRSIVDPRTQIEGAEEEEEEAWVGLLK